MTAKLATTIELYRQKGARIGGYAAYFDAPPDPAELARSGRRAAYEGRLLLDRAPKAAERWLREAIELMVDAFLLSRAANRELFATAHEIGALVEDSFGCSWEPDGADHINRCGVLALHSRVALSPGGIAYSRCSICGADDFGCDHVSGESYDGQRCVRVIHRWDADEVSLTPRPRDPRCFRVWPVVSLRETRRRGVPRGARPRCRHCASCYGRGGARDQDVTPPAWDQLQADEVEAAAATIAHSDLTAD